MSTPTLRPLSLGELLDVAFALYRMLFAPLFLIAVVTHGFPAVLELYVTMTGGPGENLLFWLGTIVLMMLLGMVGVAVTTFVVSDHYLGGTTTAGEAFSRAWPLLGGLVMLSIATTLVVGIGMLLLILPGVILAAGLAVATPALVLERIPGAGQAMRRSWDLTRGYKGKAAATLFVALFLVMLPSVALGVVAGMMAAAVPALGLLTQFAAIALQVLISPFLNVAITVLYYDLRVRKEGFDLEVLAGSLQA